MPEAKNTEQAAVSELMRKPISLHLDTRIYSRLRTLAAAKHLPMTELITRMLEDSLRAEEKREMAAKAKSA